MNYRKLQHSAWECKDHVVFIPKYRRKVLYGRLRRHLGEVFRRLARQEEVIRRYIRTQEIEDRREEQLSLS